MATTFDTLAAADRHHLATKDDFAALGTRLTWRIASIMVELPTAQGAPIVVLIVGLLQPLPS